MDAHSALVRLGDRVELICGEEISFEDSFLVL